MYGSEGCEHYFGLVRQIIPDFTFNDMISLVPKIPYLYKAYSSNDTDMKDKTSAVGEYLYLILFLNWQKTYI